MQERDGFSDAYSEARDYGEIPPDPLNIPGTVGVGYLGKDTHSLLMDPDRLRESHPSVYQTISGLQEAGKTVHAKWDAHRGTVLLVGTVVALGAVGGLTIKKLKQHTER